MHATEIRRRRDALSAMPRGVALLQDPARNKGTAFTEAERDAFKLRGLLPPHVSSQELQLARLLESFRSRPTRPRQVREPALGARPQRGALLPPAGRPSRRDDADRLHADGRPRVPAVHAHLPAAARHLRERRGPRPRGRRARELAAPRREDHRRERRRAHPRPRRPRRQRHGHPDRQARALHGVRRRAADRLPAGAARRRHEQFRAPRRSALHRAPSPARARRGVRRAGRGVRRRREPPVPRRRDPVRGLRVAQRVPAAAEVSRPHADLQRRHPGHGGRRRRGPAVRAARHEAQARRADAPVPGRRRSRHRHRGPRGRRDGRDRDGRGHRAATLLAVRLEGPRRRGAGRSRRSTSGRTRTSTRRSRPCSTP